MEKENGEGEAGGKQPPPPDGLLDAAGLFGAYWGRDGSSAGGAAAAAQAQAAQAALFGFGTRYPPPTTLGVAANQAASLGLHPAASAAWWSMASHLAAQDYLARLQASGLNFPPLGDPYSALSALQGLAPKQQKMSKTGKSQDRSGRSSASSTTSRGESKEKPSSSTSQQPSMRSSYGFPKSSSPSSGHSQSLSSLASLNNLVSGQSKSSKQTMSTHSRNKTHSGHSSHGGQQSSHSTHGASHGTSHGSHGTSHGSHGTHGASGLKDTLALLHGAGLAGHRGLKGKNMSSLYPFGMPGSEKDRRSGIDSLTGLPHTILSAALEGGDPASVLGGVRLPPDTEIIKYTSSLAGAKGTPGSTNRGRKKTISLDPPHVSVHPTDRAERTERHGSGAKRMKLDEYGNSKSSVEVIRLPNRPDKGSLADTPPPNLADYAGISRELLQTIASQSGVSLAALEKQLAGTAAVTDAGLDLSRKPNSVEESPLELGSKAGDEDAPLNLSMKPSPPSNQASDALSRLTSLSSSLSVTNTDRNSRRGSGRRRPTPERDAAEDIESLGWPSREGRPRNLGRGVSKPKKNTVASLLAQSRALGLRPALAQQLLAETDLEKLKALLGETGSTDSECPSDSPSDSDASDPGRRPDSHCRMPLAMGWKRSTIIKGLSRNCNIKGDVFYYPPEPHSAVKLRNMQELQAYLEQNPCPPLSAEHFSFSSRRVLGDYTQPADGGGDTYTFNETEILKRLEEARALVAMSGVHSGHSGRTPPPLDRRMELARQQQREREARKDTPRPRDQARLARELERNERAEMAKKEKEAKSQQLLEHINKNRTQLTIEPVLVAKEDDWKSPEFSKPKDRTMPPISLTLIPINSPKAKNSPSKATNIDQSNWKNDAEQYNALDKMKDFAEKAAFDVPKRKDSRYDFSLTKSERRRLKTASVEKENSLERLLETYSRLNEFINGCDWSKTKASDTKNDNPKDLEKKYLDAKNEFMTENLMLLPKEKPKSILKEVIDLSEEDDNILSDIISKKINKGTFNIGKDGALSISVHSPTKALLAKRRKHEDIEKQRLEEQNKRQQERELKRQQTLLLKEQQKYITEERERRRTHLTFLRQLDARKRWEERERSKHQNLLDRLLAKEKKLNQRRKEMELLSELRRPQEDSTLSDQKSLPVLGRIPGLCLPGEAMAGAVQLVEFLHTFARPLGFDPDSIPSLETLQLGLVPDCCLAAEEELLQVLTHLLVAAIEDPGIPHPGRHTTLLGQAIRLGDITPANISEVLRIYLYANATGEVKALTGLSIERERERRIPDHHQTDSEMAQVISTSKNTAYYEALHCNATYKLSECLRDKPFLALNATAKAKILAYLCDELLQNKAVLRQIDASLENLNQLKKERYLMDMKIRKVRVQYQRKLRTEHSEKQQALALERMQKLVEESTANLSQRTDGEETPSQTPEKNDPSKQRDKESPTPENNGEKDPSIDQTHSPFKTEESDKELSPIKDMTSNMKSKALLNNNKDDNSVEHKDKDSVMGDCDAALSDLESEGTQPEEDEDKNLSSEELSRKLEKLLRQSEQQLQHLYAGSHALRATCYGQDRYWRRYWSFGKCGGIYVEGMESAQPEILDYHRALEEHAVRENPSLDSRKRRKKGAKEKKEIPPPDVGKQEQEVTNEDAIKTEMELKSIKSELNLSDHTQIIKYEPNVKAATKMTGSSIKMEEKFIQQKQNKEEEDMLDIEDSIPTAFLVQKPTLNQKPIFTNQSDSEKPQETVKTDSTVKTENPEPKEEVKDDLVNNLEELRKMAEAVSSQLEAAKKAEEEEKLKEDIKEEKVDIKKEEVDVDAAHETLYAKMLEGKWFSILRHESAFLTNINDEKRDKPVFRDNDQTCAEIITTQGHKWDVSNNLHLLNDPSLFTLNSMVTAVQVPSNNIYLDSSLTMSGLEEDVLNSSVIKSETSKEDIEEEQENDLEIELKADALKAEAIQKAKANSLTSLGLLNYNALSTYVTCDSPPPIQMAPEEVELLESCKANGLPKKLEGNYVPRELRHGWWRITCPDQLKQVMEALHPRGVRERELIQALTLHVPTMANKLYIDKGDPTVTELSVSHTDRAITQNGGFANPDPCGAFSSLTARRVDMQALTMVEQLEERVAAASMQVKGWRPSRCPLLEEASGAEIVSRARHKLAGLEGAIERRYLKPPLGQRHTGSVEATICGTGAGTGTESSAESRNTDTADGRETKGISRGLASWREAAGRCNTSAQLAMLVQALEAAVAWDKSIMKANCQFCQSGDNEDQLLLCDGCDKGYHTYCFKPRMENIPEGDWYCWECVNKARGARACVVCGGARAGRVLVCALCPRALHPACLAPPLHKIPRGKWYCVNCISRAPPKKPRSVKKRENKHKDTSGDLDQSMVPSPAASHASTSTTTEECSAAIASHDKCDSHDNKHDENGLSHHSGGDFCEDSDAPPEKRRALHYGGNGAVDNDLSPPHNMDGDECSADDAPLLPRGKKDKRRGHKELGLCKSLLSEMECHEHAWPFLLPVNTKQFPQYKKVIKTPMDLSTIKRKLTENSYKCKDEFAADIRLIFSNCEVFNEDDSPVGRAGHNMRQFFEEKWTQI